MLTQYELAKLKVILTKNAIPFRYNSDRLITIPAVISILELLTKKEKDIPQIADILKK